MNNYSRKVKSRFRQRLMVTAVLAGIAHVGSANAQTQTAENPSADNAGTAVERDSARPGLQAGQGSTETGQGSSETKFQEKAWDGTRPEFEYLDTNSNQALEWREIAIVYSAELEQLEWDQSQAIGRFDQNGDAMLSEVEYSAFLNALIRETGLEVNFAEPEEVSARGTSSMQEGRGKLLLAQVEAQPIVVDNGDAPVGEGAEGDVPGRDAGVEVSGTAVAVTPQNLQGMRVVNLHAQELGEVAEVVVTEQGQLSGLVVTISDLASVDDKAVFVSAAEMEPTGEVVIWRTNMNEEDMEGLPDYNNDTLSQSVY